MCLRDGRFFLLFEKFKQVIENKQGMSILLSNSENEGTCYAHVQCASLKKICDFEFWWLFVTYKDSLLTNNDDICLELSHYPNIHFFTQKVY